MVMKKCVVCGKDFDAIRSAITCSKKCSKEHNKEYKRQRARKWHKEHPIIKKCIICGKEFNARGSARTCSKECSKKNNKQQWKQYHQNNKERKSEYDKKYYQDNKEKILEYQKQYRKNNKEKKIEYDKKYYQDNKEELNTKRYEHMIKEIDELKRQYNGNLDKILENVPTGWHLREAQMQVWFNESYCDSIIAKIKSTSCCEVTGEKDNLVIHHLWSFDTHPELGNDPTNMVRITEDVHKTFHKEYGYGNNTPKQWEKFVNNYLHN